MDNSLLSKRLIIFVSGLSGAGKTTALSLMNDIGFYTADNLPVDMTKQFLDKIPQDNQPIALGYGIKTVGFNPEKIIDYLKQLSLEYDVKLLFLTASPETIHHRYSLTGMTHPLCDDGDLDKAIKTEYTLCSPLIEAASLVLETTYTGPKELRRKLLAEYHHSLDTKHPLLVLSSFGFKYGTPNDAETIIDARVLDNPHWQKEISHLTGKDIEVESFLENSPKTFEFLNDVILYLEKAVIPYFNHEKSFYHVAIGCTGGKHRSVYIAEKIFKHFKVKNIRCRLDHRHV